MSKKKKLLFGFVGVCVKHFSCFRLLEREYRQSA